MGWHRGHSPLRSSAGAPHSVGSRVVVGGHCHWGVGDLVPGITAAATSGQDHNSVTAEAPLPGVTHTVTARLPGELVARV